MLFAALSGTHLKRDTRNGSKHMSDHVYKKIEITGSSKTSMEDAVENAIAHAAKTVHGMRWFEVTETRGDISDGKIDHWQVTLKIGFTLDK